METDLIFNRGIDLPGFSTLPLLQTDDGREILRGYYRDLVAVARKNNVGAFLDSVTWTANPDRAAALGLQGRVLQDLNLAAIDMITGIQRETHDVPTILCAQIGPRGDGYKPGFLMTPTQSEAYHAPQIALLSKTKAQLLSAFTLNYAEEAVGIIQAAKRQNMPVSVSFTVETDGRLPNGMTIKDAIEHTDEEPKMVRYFSC
jgi:homocysteine S-methyltransferase